MKKILLITIMLIDGFSMTAQVLNYEQVKNAKYEYEINKKRIKEYISKDGTSFKIGDVLKIDKPLNGHVFSSMTIIKTTFESLLAIDRYDEVDNYDYNVYARTIAKTSLKIKSFVIEGDKNKGFTIAANLDGTTHNIQVRLEYGIEIGEIGEHKMTSEEALAKLKSEKDKLELGLITSDEYNSRKLELAKFIN